MGRTKGVPKKQQKQKPSQNKQQKQKQQQKQKRNGNSASVSSPAAKSTVVAATKSSNSRIIVCDICQMIDGFRGMGLLSCQKCGVNVHGECYGTRLDPDDNNGSFVCWACAAVGTTVKVRDRDPFTKQRVAIQQPKRPKECCLCSVQDGIHAMHPIFDAHGKRGRQIWLPPTASSQGERKLAWAHTLCALTINSNPFTRGTCYGCTRTGFYGDPDDLECVSDSESINSDLDVDLQLEQDDPTDVHHFVYWGHLDQQHGRKPDEWGRSIETHKRDVKCYFCGVDDSKKIQSSKGYPVFESLRIPLQCTANNPNEFSQFQQHRGGCKEPCYQGLHVGCAMWGRNDQGEQSRARRVWFFPGFPDHPKPLLRQHVVEVNCDFHAREILKQGVKGANMEHKLPGPFEGPGPSKSNNSIPKQQQTQQQNRTVQGVSSRVGAQAKAPLHLRKRASSGSLEGTDGLYRESVARKHSKDAKRPASSAPASETAGGGGGSAPIMLARQKKPAHASISSDAVALNQNQRKGRLVKMKSNNKAASEGDPHHLELTQQILDDLLQHKQDFNTTTTKIQRRFHWKAKADYLSSEEFSTVWQHAVDAMKVGHLDDLKVKLGEAAVPRKKKRRLSQSEGEDSAESNNGHKKKAARLTESDLPRIPRRNSKTNDTNQESNTDSRTSDKKKKTAEKDPQADDDNDGGMAFDNDESESATKDAALPQSQDTTVVHDNRAASDKENYSTEDQERREESIENIANDLVKRLEPYETPPADEEARSHAHAVSDVLKTCRLEWKAKLGLSKAEFKPLYAEALSRMLGICRWFRINGITPTPPPPGKETPAAPPEGAEKEENIATAPEEEAAVPGTLEGVETTEHSKEIERANNEHEEEGAAAQPNDNESPTDVERSSSPSPEPSRWSYLTIGKHYNKKGFQFDSWDTYEQLPTVVVSFCCQKKPSK